MPLLKRKPLPLINPPDPDSITDPSQEVFQIRFTGEIFTNYE